MARRTSSWDGRPTEAIGRFFGDWLIAGQVASDEARGRLRDASEWHGELHLRAKRGQERIVFGRWNVIRDDDGHPTAILSAHTDITEQKKIEAIHLRAQRMETIGSLAAGIAHDLNNILSPAFTTVGMLKDCQDQAARGCFR